ncbi:hypothetical protein AERO9AM_10470 [Aeromicrobium sp. 9AM]|nr:hypothetical protein AERO9AM_10470 [Aeromicrobium sp. 9AM]
MSDALRHVTGFTSLATNLRLDCAQRRECPAHPSSFGISREVRAEGISNRAGRSLYEQGKTDWSERNAATGQATLTTTPVGAKWATHVGRKGTGRGSNWSCAQVVEGDTVAVRGWTALNKTPSRVHCENSCKLPPELMAYAIPRVQPRLRSRPGCLLLGIRRSLYCLPYECA